MKGMGLAVFSEPASPVPGYNLSRIMADPEQSQEMKLTHRKLHYSRVRILVPGSVSNVSWSTWQGQHRKAAGWEQSTLLGQAQPIPASPCSGAPAALPLGLGMLCCQCTHGSAFSQPPVML